MTNWPLTDLALARRLERTEAMSNVAFVEARARLTPGGGAGWLERAGTYAMYDGAGSPCTQTFGLGMFAPVTVPGLAEFEEFYQSRGAEVHHEVSPLADGSVLQLLPGRGYRPIEFTSVMCRPMADFGSDETRGITVRRPLPSEAELWARIAAAGWRDVPEVADLVFDLGLVMAHTRGTACFLAEHEGIPIAAGALSLRGDVALMGGASTIPEWRGRGAQTALLHARLAFGVAEGAELAMMCALPGSASQRNAERQGFRIAYTRTKWQLVQGD